MTTHPPGPRSNLGVQAAAITQMRVVRLARVWSCWTWGHLRRGRADWNSDSASGLCAPLARARRRRERWPTLTLVFSTWSWRWSAASKTRPSRDRPESGGQADPRSRPADGAADRSSSATLGAEPGDVLFRSAPTAAFSSTLNAIDIMLSVLQHLSHRPAPPVHSSISQVMVPCWAMTCTRHGNQQVSLKPGAADQQDGRRRPVVGHSIELVLSSNTTSP